jgi:hypothetical protein
MIAPVRPPLRPHFLSVQCRGRTAWNEAGLIEWIRHVFHIKFESDSTWWGDEVKSYTCGDCRMFPVRCNVPSTQHGQGFSSRYVMLDGRFRKRDSRLEHVNIPAGLQDWFGQIKTTELLWLDLVLSSDSAGFVLWTRLIGASEEDKHFSSVTTGEKKLIAHFR